MMVDAVQGQEETLRVVRTHPKVLVGPLFLQLILIVVHVLVMKYLPTDTDMPAWNEWAPTVIHVAIAVLEVIYFVLPLLRWQNTTFTVTTKRVITNWGIFYKKSRDIRFENIVSVSTDRGILDRIFRCGTVVFHNAASESAAMNEQYRSNTLTKRNGGDRDLGVRFHDVSDPEGIEALVNEQRFNQA